MNEKRQNNFHKNNYFLLNVMKNFEGKEEIVKKCNIL